MEKKLEDFVVHGGRHTEYTIKYISQLLEKDSGYPSHIVDALLSIRSHAEQDKQNFLSLQAFITSQESKRQDSKDETDLRHQLDLDPSSKEPKTAQSFLQDEKKANGAAVQPVGSGDDLFLLEGVDRQIRPGVTDPAPGVTDTAPVQSSDENSPSSISYSDGEGEQSDGDEGIHLPRKHRHNKEVDIACSLPVRIPLPEQLQRHRADIEGREMEENEDNVSNIAASIQAMARSVATSSMFGDPMFDVPRPRVNTLSKI